MSLLLSLNSNDIYIYITGLLGQKLLIAGRRNSLTSPVITDRIALQ